MKILYKICLITVFCKLESIQGIIGNLAFYGRGQRHLPNYWNDLGNTKHSPNARVYFPFKDEENEEDEEDTILNDLFDSNSTLIEEGKNSTDIIDIARNYPLVMYLPGVKDGEEYTYLDFNVNNEDNSINLYDFHKIKSEFKIEPPSIDKFIKEGYTCEDFGLLCDDLSNTTIDEIKDIWLDNVKVKLYLESEEGNKEYEGDVLSQKALHYNIKNFTPPTTEWNECVGSIDQTSFLDTNIIYSDFVIRNYGKMPVYILIGNTMFLKKSPTDMVKNGVIQNGFANWSWHPVTGNKVATYFPDEIYEGDPQNKTAARFITDTDGAFAYYVHITGGISAPPEGISFKIRPLNDNQFKFKIDNKKEFNLTRDYLVHRNCKIPIKEETTFLVDVRSLVYSDPKFMLMNDISGFWFQTISEISKIKQRLNETEGEEAAKAYKDELYFYDFTLHHTYPENPDNGEFVKEKFNENGEECSLKLETHEDWGDEKRRNDANPIIQWPDDIDYEVDFGDEEEKEKEKETEEEKEEPKPTSGVNDEIDDNKLKSDDQITNDTNDQKDSQNGSFIAKPVISLFILTIILISFFSLSDY